MDRSSFTTCEHLTFKFGHACATVKYSNVNNARYKSLWRQSIIYGNLKSFSDIWRFEDHFMANRLPICLIHRNYCI